MTNACGTQPFWPALRESLTTMVHQPTHMLRSAPFRWLALVYGATYASANLADTYCRRRYAQESTATVLVAATAANSATRKAKDRAFAQAFGSSASRAVPLATYCLWGSRDIVAIGFRITMPQHASAWLQARTDASPTAANIAAALAVPLFGNLFSTPLHLMGIHVYNEPHVYNIRTRVSAIASQMPTTLGALGVRTLAAFGLAGWVNT